MDLSPDLPIFQRWIEDNVHNFLLNFAWVNRMRGRKGERIRLQDKVYEDRII